MASRLLAAAEEAAVAVVAAGLVLTVALALQMLGYPVEDVGLHPQLLRSNPVFSAPPMHSSQLFSHLGEAIVEETRKRTHPAACSLASAVKAELDQPPLRLGLASHVEVGWQRCLRGHLPHMLAKTECLQVASVPCFQGSTREDPHSALHSLPLWLQQALSAPCRGPPLWPLPELQHWTWHRHCCTCRTPRRLLLRTLESSILQRLCAKSLPALEQHWLCQSGQNQHRHQY
mmetsp:Transcript_30972/g.72248  ORF Transcript_30972/g.72248 Transcript_30972/m.72248 type:complete len:231 (+) Transcript_30972:373-1065(+)